MLVPSEGGIFIYMITKKCLECGIEFEKITKISKKQWKLRKFCSQKCHYTFKKGKYFINSGTFKKGHKINVGKSPSEETKQKIRETMKGKFKGDKHPNWKGDKASYTAFHIWINSNFGKANKCGNPNCVYPRKDALGKMMYSPKAYHWALKKGYEHGHNRNSYAMLCVSCHKKYDNGSLILNL